MDGKNAYSGYGGRENTKKNPTFIASAKHEEVVAKIMARARDLEPLGVITKAELVALSGEELIFTKKRYLLDRARRRLLRDEQILLCSVHKVGLQRANDTLKIDDSEVRLQRGRSAIRKSQRSLESIENFQALSTEEKRKFLSLQTITGLLNTISESGRVKQLESRVMDGWKKLDWKEGLDFLRGT
jgi:hypothetical protein